MIIGDDGLKKLKSMLIDHEGLRLKAYPDPLSSDGKPWTIGYGHTGKEVIEGLIISKMEADDYLDKDIFSAEQDLIRNFAIYKKLSDARKLVLLNMCFNLGVSRLLNFRNMFKCIINMDFVNASKEILNSKAAKDLPSRYKCLANIMEKGTL